MVARATGRHSVGTGQRLAWRKGDFYVAAALLWRIDSGDTFSFRPVRFSIRPVKCSGVTAVCWCSRSCRSCRLVSALRHPWQQWSSLKPRTTAQLCRHLEIRASSASRARPLEQALRSGRARLSPLFRAAESRRCLTHSMICANCICVMSCAIPCSTLLSIPFTPHLSSSSHPFLAHSHSTPCPPSRATPPPVSSSPPPSTSPDTPPSLPPSHSHSPPPPPPPLPPFPSPHALLALPPALPPTSTMRWYGTPAAACSARQGQGRGGRGVEASEASREVEERVEGGGQNQPGARPRRVR